MTLRPKETNIAALPLILSTCSEIDSSGEGVRPSFKNTDRHWMTNTASGKSEDTSFLLRKTVEINSNAH